MNRETRLQVSARVDKAIYIILLILAAASCVSEPLSRNAVRVLLVLLFFRMVLVPPQKEIIQRYKGFAFIFMGFFLILTVLALQSGDFFKAIQDSVYVYNYNMLLPFIVVLGIHRENQLIWITRLMLASIVAVDFYIFWQSMHGIARPISFIRVAVMTTAMMYVIILPILFTILINWHRLSIRQRMLYSLVSILTLAAFILNGTRGAWLAILVLLPLLFFFNFVSWKKTAVLAVAVAGLLFKTCAVLPGALQRVQSVGDMQDIAQYDRVLIWRGALYMGLSHPVLGAGLGNFGEQYAAHYYVAAEAKEPSAPHAHNSFLQFFAEGGILGLLGYCTLFGYCLFRAWKQRENCYARTLFLSTLALLVFSLTDYTYAGFPAMRLYWLFLGLCLCGMDLKKRLNTSD